MATCTDNKVTADAFIVSLYPEIVGMEAFMDSLAALGRLVYVVTLEDPDHGPAVKANIETQLASLGYKVTLKETTVTVSCAG
jgi:hypothetical protein